MNLKVKKADKEVILNNIIKLKSEKIKELNCGKIKEYKSIIRIKCSDIKCKTKDGKCKKVYVWVRPIDTEKKHNVGNNLVYMDDYLRKELNVKYNEEYEFEIKKSWRIAYYGHHPNPIVRIAFWLTLFSITIGVLSLLIGIGNIV